jgi:hypothetical protein
MVMISADFVVQKIAECLPARELVAVNGPAAVGATP